nr:MAG: replication associated protein [Cressdnaviricota sp.]
MLRYKEIKKMVSRDWCFTWFGENLNQQFVTDMFEKLYEQEKIKYVVCQIEKCPDTDRLHLQGYLECVPMRFTQAQKITGMEGAHFEKRKGSQEQAINYCKKEESREEGPWEWGTKSFKKQLPAKEKSAKFEWDDVLDSALLALRDQARDILFDEEVFKESTGRSRERTDKEKITLNEWRLHRNEYLEKYGTQLYGPGRSRLFFFLFDDWKTSMSLEDV